ncbi:MAG: cytochrome b N-terminal domain-containing protein [Gammaproteobacteria bacterium]|nr:MAG: cytochrome b N-terminal domain-containing protein [Gammaproteobacteria bacterium]
MTTPRRIARAAFESVDKLFDRAFTPAWNPLYHLGTLGWFFYWIVIVSGIYLYIFFDTGINQAYESLEYITNVQWYAGGVMRSLHRYASDALIIVMMLHLVREFVMDRYRGARWFSWFTGVPLLWLVFACGISGYWMVWDVLAQYIAIATTEWLDSLGIFGQSIARNFLNSETLSGRFFTLMVFIHIAVPLFMLLVMWIHIQRQRNAKVNPPRGLAAGTLGMLLLLSFIEPAVSQPPANLDIVPAVIDFDWFYLLAYPLLDRLPGLTMWAVAAAGTLLLLLLPLLPPLRHEPAAVVDLDNCNGCGRCVEDCPFSAVSLQPRTDGAAFSEEAIVSNNLCLSCGICVGACPTSTPFRRTSELVPGIDLPDQGIRALREKTLSQAEKLTGMARIIVYVCEHGPELEKPENDQVGVIKLPCIAQLPPAFIDFIISRRHAEGVFLAGCAEGDCYYRLGQQWVDQRLAGERDPYLRKRVPRERIAKCWAGITGNRRLQRELTAFHDQLKVLPPLQQRTSSPVDEASAEQSESRG